jgi:hypothetical protein
MQTINGILVSLLLAAALFANPVYAGFNEHYYGEGTYGCGVKAPADDALIWSSRGGNPTYDFCCGKSDDTPLPQDPRSLVQPGISDGKNVVFNIYWRNCHAEPELVGEYPNPTTCGELRQRVEAGHKLMVPGQPGAASLFSGTDPYSWESLLGTGVMTSKTYNSIWKSWGLDARPPNYDYLLAQRYGSPVGTEPNPYPLPGEDPNKTNGGSGQLPIVFTQIRKANGTWTGDIGVTCQGCHNGEVGDAYDGEGLGMQIGGGSSMVDWDLFLQDMLPFTGDYLAAIATHANLNRTRGTNNASDVNIAFLFPDEQKYDSKTFFGLLLSGSTAGLDTPAWWNMGHRPAKFIDGLFPMDAPRVDMVFYTPFMGLFGKAGGKLAERGQDWMRQNAQNGNEWVQILKSPPYPEHYDAIDMARAERGAVLFHELDLWSPDRNNPVPVPAAKGNGSCASCHGAYAPKYFNNPDYLASPVLEGQAGNVTEMRVIGTDPARYNTNNESMVAAGAYNFFGYPQLIGTENECSPIKTAGYLAPPLYGVWANAPYLHNGSIPNLWQLLKPTDRVAIWERVSAPKPEGQDGDWLWSEERLGNIIMNYDTDIERAFDFEKVGWKYVTHRCDSPHADCKEAHPLWNFLFSNVMLLWNVLAPADKTTEQMEARKIYNTMHYAQGNKGHEFTGILTDEERLELIEYMKTL